MTRVCLFFSDEDVEKKNNFFHRMTWDHNPNIYISHIRLDISNLTPH